MSNIEEMERRIVSAMDRIAQGISNLDAGGAGDTDDLKAALEDEKLANAQLNERVRKLSDQVNELQGISQERIEAAAKRIQALDLELQRMRKASEQLRTSNAELRAANEAGVGEPHLINKAMMAELEALRAARAADVAEADTILSAMDALMGQEGMGQEEIGQEAISQEESANG